MGIWIHTTTTTKLLIIIIILKICLSPYFLSGSCSYESSSIALLSKQPAVKLQPAHCMQFTCSCCLVSSKRKGKRRQHPFPPCNPSFLQHLCLAHPMGTTFPAKQSQQHCCSLTFLLSSSGTAFVFFLRSDLIFLLWLLPLLIQTLHKLLWNHPPWSLCWPGLGIRPAQLPWAFSCFDAAD